MLLGFGVDLLHAARIGQLVGRRGLPRLARRILTADELALLASVHEPEAQERFLAVRWAAKEALYKAVQPHYAPTWKDVAVLPSSPPSPKPQLVFSPLGKLAHVGLHAYLSVSHDGDYLVAGVVVERRE